MYMYMHIVHILIFTQFDLSHQFYLSHDRKLLIEFLFFT